MGKKHVATENQEQAIKESEKVDQNLKKDVKVKASTRIAEGRVYVSSSYNNTIVTLTDHTGRVLVSKSAGAVGFKGTKKSTSFAASKVSEAIVLVCQKLGMEKISVFIRGIGAGRESAVRTLVNKGLNVIAIRDITPIPHNGCRPKKIRRV